MDVGRLRSGAGGHSALLTSTHTNTLLARGPKSACNLANQRLKNELLTKPVSKPIGLVSSMDEASSVKPGISTDLRSSGLSGGLSAPSSLRGTNLKSDLTSKSLSGGNLHSTNLVGNTKLSGSLRTSTRSNVLMQSILGESNLRSSILPSPAKKKKKMMLKMVEAPVAFGGMPLPCAQEAEEVQLCFAACPPPPPAPLMRRFCAAPQMDYAEAEMDCFTADFLMEECDEYEEKMAKPFVFEERPVPRSRVFEVPKYELQVEWDIPAYQLPAENQALTPERVDETGRLKRQLVNAVCGSLINSPKFADGRDPTRCSLIEIGDQLILKDPEFILKVALYCRRSLNIRTTANFLVTYAAARPECREYLAKYFNKAVVLPSDWIEIAQNYAAFAEGKSTQLPAALRKVLVAKFPDFDEYQLGKYNKGNSSKKPKPKTTKEDEAKAAKIPDRGKSKETETDDREEEEKGEKIGSTKYSLKQMIRKLHITEPVHHVMCIIGKKYPSTSEDFYLSRLPGTFDEGLAGQRMKLQTPVTWETQISLRGNKAAVWEELLDKRKLPFMAMLRNLRNMIKAGMSRKHHQQILRKLGDQNAVINSKQLPFRFLSAYQVLSELQAEYEKAAKPKRVTTAVNKKFKKDTPWWQIKRAKKLAKSGSGESKYDLELLTTYKKALDTALKIATTHNLSPIKGVTVILCNIGKTMSAPYHTGGSKRTLLDLGLLLGLMCKYCCEHCDFILFGDNIQDPAYIQVDLEKGTLLDNMNRLVELAEVYTRTSHSDKSAKLPEDYFMDMLQHRKKVDNLIIVSDEPVFEEPDPEKFSFKRADNFMQFFLHRYRREVDRALLFVEVSLKGSKFGKCKYGGDNPNNVLITGFSDQILRFVAEQGSLSQLSHVDKIDQAFGLEDGRPRVAPLERYPPSVVDIAPRWRTLRVFISSTFRDMHGERDLLTRFVFPELRSLARKKLIHVSEVDLRWGVTNENSCSSVESCLKEVSRSDMFVGMLGHRYGSIAACPDHLPPPLEWLKGYEPSSLTELEFYYGVLSEDRCIPEEDAFLYVRDNVNVPDDVREDFHEITGVSQRRIQQLRVRAQRHGKSMRYRARWGGIVDGKPMVTDLHEFGSIVLNNLWDRILQMPDPECGILTERRHLNNLHRNVLNEEATSFTSRKKLVTDTKNAGGNLIVIHGPQGSGKTALLAKILHTLEAETNAKSLETYVLAHFSAHIPGAQNEEAMLRRFVQTLADDFSVDQPQDMTYRELVDSFQEVVHSVADKYLSRGRLFIGIDGLDSLDSGTRALLSWLPARLPKNVFIYVTCTTDAPAHRLLLERKQGTITQPLDKLNTIEKSEIVRNVLAKYGKKLDESAFNNELKLVASKKDANWPMYLKLVCEELRMLGIYEELRTRIKNFPQTVSALLQLVLARLEQEHGEKTVKLALSLIYLADEGLPEVDIQWLLGVAAADSSSKWTIQKIKTCDMRLTATAFCPLLRALVDFLRCPEDGSTVHLKISHQDIHTAVFTRYLKLASATQQVYLNRLLAGLYLRHVDPDHDGSYLGMNKDAFSNLPKYLCQAECFQEYVESVCNLRFVEAKALLHLTDSMIGDYSLEGLPSSALSKIERIPNGSSRIAAYREFVASNLHVFKSNPGLVYQSALNHGGLLEEEADLCAPSMVRVIKKRNETRPDLMMDSFSSTVMCVAISRDGSVLACGLADGDIQICDIATGQIIRILSGHSDKVTSLSFGASNVLVSASTDTSVIIWNHSQGTSVYVLKSHTRVVSDVACNPQGWEVASTGWDCTICVWSVKKGKLLGNPIKDRNPFNCVTFHPDAPMLATGGWDGRIKLWRYNDTVNIRRAVLTGHETSVRTLCYSDDGRHLYSSSLRGTINIWSAAEGKLIGSFLGHMAPVNGVSLSDRTLISCGDDWKVKLWRSSIGKAIFTHQKKAAATCLNLSNDGKQMVVGYYDGVCNVYDIEKGISTLDMDLGGHSTITAVKIEPDTPHNIYCTNQSGLLMGFDASGTVFHRESFTNGLTALGISNDNKLVGVAEDNEYAVVVTMMMMKNHPGKVGQKRFLGHTGPITSISFYKQGTQPIMITTARDGMVMTWNVRTGSKVNEFSAHEDWVTGSALVNDGEQQLLTCSNDFNLRLWNVEEGRRKREFTGHQAAVNSVAQATGYIVSGSSDGCVKIFSCDGSDVTRLHGHTSRVNGCDIVDVKPEKKGKSPPPPRLDTVEWSQLVDEDEWEEEHRRRKMTRNQKSTPDLLAATCCDDGIVIVWKPFEITQLSSLCAHTDRVVSVSTDKTRACTAATDGKVCIWPLDDGKTLDEDQHKSQIVALSVTRDGGCCLSASWDGELKLWNCDADNDAQPKLLLSHQAHESCLTAAALSPGYGGSQRIATTNADCELIIWKCGERDSVSYVTQEKLVTQSAVVHCMVWMSDELLLVGSEDGRLTAIHVELGELGFTPLFNERITELHAVPGSDNVFLAFSEYPHADEVKVNFHEMNRVCTFQSKVGGLSACWNARTMASCSPAGVEWYGTGSGELLTSPTDPEQPQIRHQLSSHEIRSAWCHGEYIVTVDDNNLRVVDTNNKTQPQIGHFVSPCPLTHVRGASRSQGEEFTFVCGDQLGNVRFLQWKPRTRDY